MLDRILYHSPQDLSALLISEKIAEASKRLASNELPDVLDLFEYYNIHRLADESAFDGVKQDIEEYIDLATLELRVGFLKKQIHEDPTQFVVTHYDSIGRHHQNDLWRLLLHTKAYKKLDREVVGELFCSSFATKEALLANQELADHFGVEIKSGLDKMEDAAEWVVRARLETDKSYCLPKNTTLADVHRWIERYLNLEQQNLNYVQALNKNPGAKGLELTVPIKLFAKQVEQRLVEDILTEDNAIVLGVQIVINEELAEPAAAESDGLILTYKYQRQHLEQLAKAPMALFRMYTDLFRLTSSYNISTLIYKPSESTFIDFATGLNTHKEFKVSQAFLHHEQTMFVHMAVLLV